MDFQSVHFECRMVLFYTVRGKSRLKINIQIVDCREVNFTPILLYKSTCEYGCHRALPDVLQISDLHF